MNLKYLYTFFVVLLTNANTNAQSCLPLGIVISSQADLEQFLLDFPDCKVIEGDVTISGGDITDLSSLEAVEQILGTLTIRDCDALESIAPLSNIGRLGSLVIRRCESLTSVTGFDNILAMDKLVLSDVGSVTNFNAFENLQSLTDSLYFWRLGIDSLVGFDDLQEADRIEFRSLDLQSFRGFNSLKVAWQINFSSFSCREFIGFDSLRSTTSLLSCGADDLEKYDGFHQLDSVGTTFGFYGDAPNGGVQAFEKLRTTGNVILSTNMSILSPSFESLTTIKQDLFVRFCTFENLDFLSGLRNTAEKTADIRISGCPNLTDISGLDGFISDSIRSVRILNNPLLKVCHSDLVCAVLENPDPAWQSIISGNAPGCTSIEEVLEQCALKEDDDDDDPMADLCPMTSRPGMQIDKQIGGSYKILYSYGEEQMYLYDIDESRLTDMVVHFKMEKEVLFDFDSFDLKTFCNVADELARGSAYEHDSSLTIGMDHYVEQILEEASYLIHFAKLIGEGECVKL